MTQNWWNNKYVNRRDYLLEEFQNLELSKDDLFLLMMMDYLKSCQDKIDTKVLAKWMKMSEDKIQSQLSKLVSEGWLNMEVTNKDITYSLDPLFEKKRSTKQVKTLFDLFEEQFGRPLSAMEIKKLSIWSVNYNQEKIEDALRQSIVYKAVNFKYIETILQNRRG